MSRHPFRRPRRHSTEPALQPQPEPGKSGGTLKLALETGRTRLAVTGCAFAVAFLFVGLRLVDLTLLKQPEHSQKAENQAREATIVDRADIVDRNGVVLATTLPAASLYADPQRVLNAPDAAERLARILPELDPDSLLAELSSDRSFVWVKRGLTPREQHDVNRLGIPGLYFQREERRVYPHGALTAHVVGFTNIDSKGLAGIERYFDNELRDRTRPLALSIDLRLQHILAHELSSAMAEFRAVGAAGMVADARTGEILAMISLPSFDPNEPGSAPADARFNRASLGVYEMGSVFKIFTTAMALDSGLVSLDDGFDTRRPIRVARFTITDFKPKNRWLSIPEIFIYSSNIGTVHMALEVGTATQQAYLARLGLMQSPTIELLEIGQPMVPSPWREINTMTVAYGHGMAVSSVQLISAVSAVVNGGMLRPVTLVKQMPDQPQLAFQVLSDSTSFKMRWLLRLAVMHGTGKNADVPGYAVGGKTGTAEKLVDGRYVRDARTASFVGAFPMDAPRFVIFAMLDEPKPTENTFGYATGGWVAAPAVGRVIERMALLYGIEPDETEENPGEGTLFVSASAKSHSIALE